MPDREYVDERTQAFAEANRLLRKELEDRDHLDFKGLADTVNRLRDLVEELSRHVQLLNKMSPDMEKKVVANERRIQKLEIWQAWLIGAGAGIVAILSMLVPLVFKIYDTMH